MPHLHLPSLHHNQSIPWVLLCLMTLLRHCAVQKTLQPLICWLRFNFSQSAYLQLLSLTILSCPFLEILIFHLMNLLRLWICASFCLRLQWNCWQDFHYHPSRRAGHSLSHQVVHKVHAYLGCDWGVFRAEIRAGSRCDVETVRVQLELLSFCDLNWMFFSCPTPLPHASESTVLDTRRSDRFADLRNTRMWSEGMPFSQTILSCELTVISIILHAWAWSLDP